MLKNYDYHCPGCNFKLTHNQKIRFLVRNTKGVQANLWLSAVPGEYGYESDNGVQIRNGEKIDFFCTNCCTNLLSKRHEEFVEINLKVTEGILFTVLFSPICGEKITYVIMEDEMVKYRDNFYSLINSCKEAG